jgi:transcriptional regulator with XRE-family HTH domain
MANSDNENSAKKKGGGGRKEYTDKRKAQEKKCREAFASKLKAARIGTGLIQEKIWEHMRNGHASAEDETYIFEKSPLEKHQAYNLYETGKNSPSLSELRRLAYYCNVSTDELLGMYDTKYFYRLIKKKYPKTIITTTDKPLAQDKWPNEEDKELRIKVFSSGAEYYPDIEALEGIQQACWNAYKTNLGNTIYSYLENELRKESNFSKDQLEFFERLHFLVLNELLNEPLIGSGQTATSAYESYSGIIKNNRELYEGCFQSNINNAIYFHLMTNIDPSKDNRIPSYLKLYALKNFINSSAQKSNNKLDSYRRAVSYVIKMQGLRDTFATGNGEPDLDYFRDNTPFNNKFYRYLFGRIKDFATPQDNQLQLKGPNDDQENKKNHQEMIKRFLQKLVYEGKYWEGDTWKAFTNYRPKCFNSFYNAENPKVEEIKKELYNELFGSHRIPPEDLTPTQNTKNNKRDKR